MALRSLFLDFNSYFASVEQQERSQLRGQPVAVIPVDAETTSCIAVSREARAVGVRRGMRVAEARQACPRLHVVIARPEVYLDYHHRLKAAVDACAPIEKVHSIDEMACALPYGTTTREQAIALGHAVKLSIAENVGPHVRCSIGVAPNAFLAKAACEMEKPDGLVVLDSDDLPHALHRLEIDDFSGIGPRMAARLRHAGIHTVEQLLLSPRPMLRRIWGSVEGERIHDLLHGGDAWRPVSRHALISHSHVLSPAQRNDRLAFAVLHRLLQKAAIRLRREHFFAGALGIHVEYPRTGSFQAELRFRETQDTLEFSRLLRQLWETRPANLSAPLVVGVSLFELLPAWQHTPSLFDGPTETRRARLAAAMDTVNSRFGKNAIYLASAHEALDSAPMRIAFNYIPEPGD